MSRIVVTTIGSLGDLHPKIAIALELRKRGHDVVFATHKEYQTKIAALGFEFQRIVGEQNGVFVACDEIEKLLE
ncbi:MULTISPECIES: glycosyltransferase [unclassified Microcoleus]|uniref:glycosyltransferase n=1 Tax=unclassified Microcoleus TaxID=2642155 RepID=UPI0025FD6FA3|nr:MULTISPECIES: glycosyltransferase [unclassified Microcoleus]